MSTERCPSPLEFDHYFCGGVLLSSFNKSSIENSQGFDSGFPTVFGDFSLNQRLKLKLTGNSL